MIKADETFGLRLTTYHNLHFLINLMKQVRQSIMEDRLLDFRDEFLSSTVFMTMIKVFNPKVFRKQLKLKRRG